jgi:hypothetical protein
MNLPKDSGVRFFTPATVAQATKVTHFSSCLGYILDLRAARIHTNHFADSSQTRNSYRTPVAIPENLESLCNKTK